MAITGTFSAGDQVSFKDVVIEVDQTPAASSFIAIESWSTDIGVEGGDTDVTDFNTFTTPVVLVGERNPFTVTVTCVYTETDTDPFKEIYDDYAADPGLDYDIRWSPKGGSTGDYEMTTSGGKLIQCSLPQGSASDANPITFQFMIRCSTITLADAT